MGAVRVKLSASLVEHLAIGLAHVVQLSLGVLGVTPGQVGTYFAQLALALVIGAGRGLEALRAGRLEDVV